MSIVGLYLLLRINILLLLCCSTDAGSLKFVKEKRKGLDRARQNKLKNLGLDQCDTMTLKNLHSNYDAVSNQPWCDKCQDFKVQRSHHCNTCGSCALRMDHHCPWINNCIGIGNVRFFIQLLLHVSLGSTFTLYCIWLGRNSPIWYQAFSWTWAFVFMHSLQALGFIGYYLYNLMLVNRDLTSFDLFYRQKKDKRYLRFMNLSFNAKLWLIFGTPNLFKASFYPCMRLPPLSGLEYSVETEVTNFKDFSILQYFD